MLIFICGKRGVSKAGDSTRRTSGSSVASGWARDYHIHRPFLLSRVLEEARWISPWGAKPTDTFHPVTLEQNSSVQQMKELLALKQQEVTKLIFTMPAADTEGRVLFKMIEEFSKETWWCMCQSFYVLGATQDTFLCLKQVDAVAGNSSSTWPKPPASRLERSTSEIDNAGASKA